MQYRLRPPHSPLLAVPLLRWRRLEGKEIISIYSAKNILQYNFVYQEGIFYQKVFENSIMSAELFE